MTTRSRFDTNGASPRERGCALVTGAGRGIGAAIARELAAAGWPVAVNYSSDEDGAGATAEAISEAGGRAMVVCADVAEGDAVDAMFEQVEAELGPALVLVNNAGIRNDRLVGGLAPDSWERVVDVNLSGAYNTIHRGLGGMVRARFGRVVNISTISAARPLPGQSAYAASKAGIEGLTRTVALEVARRGVTVNAIEPGLVATDFVPEMTEEWAQVVPAKRTATPAEIAAVVRFLVSDEAAYITGAVIPVDGGLSAGLGVFGRPAVGAAS
jgi:3-oxoacyl-[acyl-carrier protein] reductase